MIDKPEKPKHEGAVWMGRRGGVNSRKNLDPETRTLLAKKAANARWERKKMAGNTDEQPEIASVPPAMRQDVFSLPDGHVTIQWPSSLSQESFADLEEWLGLVQRKIGRCVKPESVGGGDGEAEASR